MLIKLRAGNIRGYRPLISDSKPSSPSFDDNGTPHKHVVISSLFPLFYILSQFPAPLTITVPCKPYFCKKVVAHHLLILAYIIITT